MSEMYTESSARTEMSYNISRLKGILTEIEVKNQSEKNWRNDVFTETVAGGQRIRAQLPQRKTNGRGAFVGIFYGSGQENAVVEIAEKERHQPEARHEIFEIDFIENAIECTVMRETANAQTGWARLEFDGSELCDFLCENAEQLTSGLAFGFEDGAMSFDYFDAHFAFCHPVFRETGE